MSTTIESTVITIEGVTPRVRLSGSEASAVDISLKEDGGEVQIYDEDAAAVRTSWDAATGRRTTPLIDATELALKTISALADDVVTFTAAHLIGGIISLATVADPLSTETDTAVDIIAALTGYADGTSFQFTIINNGASTITVTAGVGVTLSGLMTIPTNTSGTFICVVTASTTVTIYRM